jgi:PEP-CTERM motif
MEEAKIKNQTAAKPFEWSDIMTKFSPCRNFALAIVIASSVSSIAIAGTLNPNPANGTSPATSGNNTVNLIPNPANYRSPAIGCPWLLPAAQLGTEPYNTDPDNPWSFTYAATFNGTFNMTQYAATVSPTNGGANFDMTYTPGMGDPAGNDVRWMQVIDVNSVGWNFINNDIGFANDTGFPQAGFSVTGTGANGVPAGDHAFLDNAGYGAGNGVAPTDPWYGWLTSNGTDITTSTAANSTSFSDTPSLPFVPGMVVEFQTFVTQDDVVPNDDGGDDNNVTIYGGVCWGFQDVPEPSTFALLAIGGVGLLRRKRSPNARQSSEPVAC